MEEVKNNHSISMAGCKYTWEDFDKDAYRANMNRSQFVQYLYIRFKEQNRWLSGRIFEILTLLLMVMILLILLVR